MDGIELPLMREPHERNEDMSVERALRLMAGVVVLASLTLTQLHHPYWMGLTAFAGLNLVQSAFTDWCPAKTFFEWAGLESGASCAVSEGA